MAFLNNILVVVVVFVLIAAVAAAAIVVIVDLQQQCWQHEGFRNLAGNMLMEMSYLSLTSWTRRWVWYDMVF